MAWYCYTVKPGTEKKAAVDLEEHGFGSALPLEPYFRKSHNSRRRMRAWRPMIPSYIFAEVLSPLGWWHPLHLKHIRNVIGSGGKPGKINPDWLSLVCRPDDRQAAVLFAVGQKVELLDGPAKGHTARVEELRGDLIKLDMPGCNFPIFVKPENLEVA